MNCTAVRLVLKHKPAVHAVSRCSPVTNSGGTRLAPRTITMRTPLHCGAVALTALLMLGPAPDSADGTAMEPAGDPSCRSISASAVHVTWTPVKQSDMHWVAVFRSREEAIASPTPRPVLLATTKAGEWTVDDLAANTTFFFRVRGHNASAPSLARGWLPYHPLVMECRTFGAHDIVLAPGAADGSAPPPAYSGAGLWFTISLREPPSSVPPRLHVLFRELPPTDSGSVTGDTAESGRASVLARSNVADLVRLGFHSAHTGLRCALPVGGGATRCHFGGGGRSLRPGGEYALALALDGAGASDPIRLTVHSGSVYTEMYRVSEGTHDIDFLANHNAGNILGEASFLTDSGNFVLPPSELAHDPCARALARLPCRSVPAAPAACETCVAAYWDAANTSAAKGVRQQCSNPAQPWPVDNKVVEAFCGSSFSFFDWTSTPITRYCVETRRRAPTVTNRSAETVAGYAPYVSCNAPEAHVVHNDPADPVCICACYADRLIGMQPRAVIEGHCGAVDPAHLRYPQCNCTPGSVWPPEDSLSSLYIGALVSVKGVPKATFRKCCAATSWSILHSQPTPLPLLRPLQPVQCPYYYYNTPPGRYGPQSPCGTWFSLPRNGQCVSSSPVPNCTWSRQATARVVYGPQLLGMALQERFTSRSDLVRWRKGNQSFVAYCVSSLLGGA